MLGLYLRTARYYRPVQIANRLRLSVDAYLTQNAGWLTRWRYALPRVLNRDERAAFFYGARPVSDRQLGELQESADRLERGVFRLLNKELTLGYPVPWNPGGTTRLWRYNLHYFDFALDLALLVKWRGDRRAADTLRRLMREWLGSNPVGQGVGWHSYPIARRVVNWIQAVSLASAGAVFPEDEQAAAWLASLYQQTQFLEDHLEFDLSGNHLLANAKALVFAGIFFTGKRAKRWFGTGQRLLWEGLEDQILEDGGHYERSPMYHALMLQDYLEVVLAFKINDREVPGWARERLIAMADFLAGMIHPDGEIPLLADSAFGVAHRPRDILAAAEALLDVPGRWADASPGPYSAMIAPEACRQNAAGPRRETLTHFSATGYVVLRGRDPGDMLIVDAKPMGPAHLPAHGHCSLFSYELSVGGERFIVDSGVGEYEPGPWRDFWRSTRAHNTVVVDGAEQAEIWAAFRVGQRTGLVDSVCVQHPAATLFAGVHRGFVRQKEPTPHYRFIVALPGGFWAVVDEVHGRGCHAIESFVHLAPGVKCSFEEDSVQLSSSSASLRLYLYRDGEGVESQLSCVRGQTDPVQGWYAPEFGKPVPNRVLYISSNSSLPARIGYLLAPAKREVTSWKFDVNDCYAGVHIHITVGSPQGDVRAEFEVPGFRFIQH